MVDFDFFGHQLDIHYKPSNENDTKLHPNPVDGHNVPFPYFGVVLNCEDFLNLALNLKSKIISFIIEPYIRFKSQVGEQATMFFLDPSGNALKFKSSKDIC